MSSDYTPPADPKDAGVKKVRLTRWIEVSAVLAKEPADWSVFADAFDRHGCPGSIQAAEPQQISGYLVSVEGTPSRVEALSKELMRLGASSVKTREVEEQEWGEYWKRFFKPRRVGRIVVRPSWEAFELGQGDTEIVLDPGQAFGTGDHPTTRITLGLLQEVELKEKSVLDVGCGSGILSIAAKLLGAGKVAASDFEPISAEIAFANAKSNGVSFDVFIVDGFGDPRLEGPWDVIVTNIISATLIRLAPEAFERLAPGGKWIVSGIIEANWKDVLRSATACGFELVKSEAEDAWIGAVFTRPLRRSRSHESEGSLRTLMKSGRSSLRSLPRVFMPGAPFDEPIELPQSELDKLRKVLRLQSGAEIAVLPNDGTVIRCRLQGRLAIPEEMERPETEPKIRLTLSQALPKGDRIETVLRMGTEIGVAKFIIFPAERSVVRWEPAKLAKKLERLNAIAGEAAEQSYRTRLPEILTLPDLKAVLETEPGSIVLSEVEGVRVHLADAIQERLNPIPRTQIPNPKTQNPKPGESSTLACAEAVGNLRPSITLVVGPEGGWSPKELALIGDRGATLGPLVLRTDTAGPAAAAVVLLGSGL